MNRIARPLTRRGGRAAGDGLPAVRPRVCSSRTAQRDEEVVVGEADNLAGATAEVK